MAYRHTQVGKVILFSLPAAGILGGGAFLLGGQVLAGALTLGILLLSGVLFGTLTVEVDSREVRFRFGPGPIRKTLPVDRIRGARAVRNSPLHGFGIHLTPHGWLYNVSGLDAVEIEIEGGKTLRIGTDEPERLESAVRRAAGLG